MVSLAQQNQQPRDSGRHLNDARPGKRGAKRRGGEDQRDQYHPEQHRVETYRRDPSSSRVAFG